MADQTFQIGTGETYTTIAGWEAASDVSTGFWKGELKDTSAYSGVTISGVTGTPTASNYVWLTATSGNKHKGKAGTSHARLSGGGTGLIRISDSYTRIDNLELRLTGTNPSDEAIRITGSVTGVVISRCIIWTSMTATDTDGIYAGNYSMDAVVDNCIIYGFYRAGINAQNYSAAANTQTWYIDYCTIFKCGSSGEVESGGISSRTGSTATNNMNIYNTGCFDTASTYDDFANATEAGTTNWAGTHNACSDSSLTSRGISTNAQESLTTSTSTQSSGSYFLVRNNTSGTEDLQLLDDSAGNSAIGNGTDRTSSEPSTRQDFSTDIFGKARKSTPDIGASEIPALPATETFTASDTTSIDDHDSSWDIMNGTIVINSNKANSTQDSYNPCFAKWRSNIFGDAQYSKAIWTHSAGDSSNLSGVAARIHVSNITGYDIVSNDSTAYLRTIDNATTTTTLTSGTAPASGSLLRLECNGTSIASFDDGAALLSTTDSTYTSGYAGISFEQDGTVAQIDTWEGGNLGGVTYERTLSDSTTATDQQQAYEEKLRLLIDNLSVSDGLIQTLELASAIISRVLTSTLLVTDSVDSQKALFRVLSSSFFVNDSLNSLVATIFERVLTSSVSVSDSLTTQRELTRLLQSSLIITDAVLQDRNLCRLLSDNVNLVDVIARTIVSAPQIYSRILSDSLNVQDIIVRELVTLLRGYILASIKESEIEIGTKSSHIKMDTKEQ